MCVLNMYRYVLAKSHNFLEIEIKVWNDEDVFVGLHCNSNAAIQKMEKRKTDRTGNRGTPRKEVTEYLLFDQRLKAIKQTCQ